MNKFIYRFEAMSSPCELIIYHTLKKKSDKVAQVILSQTKHLEKKYNYYDSNSFLSKINSRAVNSLDQETKDLLSRAKKYYTLTNEVFDITVATIKELYRDESNEKELEVKKNLLMPYVGCNHFTIKHNKIIFDNIYTKIDFGGFVKEYAVDQAVHIFKKNKISSALINYGGDIFAHGNKPDGECFKIGIKNPLNPDEYIQEVKLFNQALTTSASYERNYTIGKTVYSHIISKTDKTDKTDKAISVSIISNNCVESGVYSTTLMINKNIPTKHQKIII